MSFLLKLAIVISVFSLPLNLFAQGSGMGAAVAGAAYNAYQNQPQYRNQYWHPNQSEFITIKGSAELAVKPESLRLVFAVTAEADTSLECSSKIRTAITEIRAGLTKMNMPEDRVVEDFIVIVPGYIWQLSQKLLGKDHLREIQKGFRMQTNLHILCNNEEQANKVMELAFQQGVTEIISFDYWHSKLDQFKKDAMRKAVEEAKGKSEILLAVFDEKPTIMNIDNQTRVNFPASLYKTIAPTPQNNQSLIPYKWNNYIKVVAFRPKTTFFAGSQEYSDFARKSQSMKPEIIVRSEITLTYESPARKQRIKMEMERIKSLAKK